MGRNPDREAMHRRAQKAEGKMIRFQEKYATLHSYWMRHHYRDQRNARALAKYTREFLKHLDRENHDIPWPFVLKLRMLLDNIIGEKP